MSLVKSGDQRSLQVHKHQISHRLTNFDELQSVNAASSDFLKVDNKRKSFFSNNSKGQTTAANNLSFMNKPSKYEENKEDNFNTKGSFDIQGHTFDTRLMKSQASKERNADEMVYLKSKKKKKDSSILVQGTNITEEGNAFSLENYDNFLKQYETKLNEQKYDLESLRKGAHARNSDVQNATSKEISKMPSIRQNQSQQEKHGHASTKAVSSAKTKLRQEP